MALHVYVHHADEDESEEKCELCVDAVQNQEIESFAAVQLSILELNTFNFSEQKNSYKSVFKKTSIDSYRFGRPPPSLV